MGTTHEGSVRVRGNRFFDIGVVGRRTGITVKPNVKKDADGLDNIDDFWDDGNDTSIAPAPFQDQSQSQEGHRHRATSYHASSQPVAETQELELSRRQHPPRINEYIDPEFVDEVLHDIPEELLSTPSSRISRSGLNSTASNQVYTSASDRPQAQESRMPSSAVHNPSRDEYPSPSLQAIKRHIDFTQDLSEAEPGFEGTPIMNLGSSYRSTIPRNRGQRMEMDSPESANRDLSQWTPNALPTAATRMNTRRHTPSHVETMPPSRIGGTISSHIRYTGPSKAFDLEFADSGSVSGPDDIADEADQEGDDSPQLPETPSRASHSILVSATPVHLRGPTKTSPSSKPRVTSEEALLEVEDDRKVRPVPAAYQFSDEEGIRDHGHEDITIASGSQKDRRTVEPDRERLAEASVREREPTDPSNSEDDAPPRRRMIRPRRAASAKKSESKIPDQAKRETSTRSNKPKQSKTKDPIAATTRSVETSGRESRKRKEPPQESTTLTLVPLERKDKPVEQDDSGIRRSNRVTFKPLAFWRNERVILGRSDNTPQPVPIIKGVVRAPPPEPAVGRGIKRSRTKSSNRYPRSQPQHFDDGEEADEEDEDLSSDPELLRQQGFAQKIHPQFECVDQATGSIVVRAESKDAMQFQDVPGRHYQYHRGLEDEDTISSGIVRIPGQGTKPNKNASASSVVYYVIQGTVQVTVYKSTVILHRGGRFLVPQGNQYMIKNLSRKECLLFFAQSKSAMHAGQMPLPAAKQGTIRRNPESPR
ncbi:hypothetical protein BGZ67_008990 [Mortierella alpina]|nr:hypothetical protein BGZ67_008990 [Mortierella alpina]